MGRVFSLAFALGLLAPTAALAGAATTFAAHVGDTYSYRTPVDHGMVFPNADGTAAWIATDREGVTHAMTARWEVRGALICFTMMEQDAVTECWEGGPEQIGQTSTATSDKGNTAEVTLVSGR